MNRALIDQGVRSSFFLTGDGRGAPVFGVRTSDHNVSNPSAHIADIVSRRVGPGAAIDFPNGMDLHALGRIRWEAGDPDQPCLLSVAQAEDLAQIGRQILYLDRIGQVYVPLDYVEETSLTHLVEAVR